MVAYEALTGRLPYAAPTPLAVLRAADLGRHEQLDPRVHGPLAEVIERAMQRLPGERFPDMQHFAAALRRPESNGASRGAVRSHQAVGSHGALPSHRSAVGSAPPSPGRGRARETVAASPPTRSFRRSSRVEDLESALPLVAPSRRRAWFAGAVAVALLAAGAVVLAMSRRDTGLPSLRVRALPTCDPQTTAQCVRSYGQTGVGVNVTFESGVTADYRAGRPGDVLRIANWFCGSRATLALYRPTTGVVYYLSGWPKVATVDIAEEAPVEIAADRTGVLDAQVGVGDHDGNGCADLALDRDQVRTWFLPSEQPGRLQKVSAVAS